MNLVFFKKLKLHEPASISAISAKFSSYFLRAVVDLENFLLSFSQS